VLLAAIRESMGRRTVSVRARAPEVATGMLSERAGVLGALALALQESEDYPGYGASDHSSSDLSRSQRQYPLAG
jgi:hypothetical protein